MSATTTLMTSTALPHDPQQVPDRPHTPRPSTPPSTTPPAQSQLSPPSPPTPNALVNPVHPVTQRPTEKDVVEDGSDSPMELEDSLDDPDISTDAAMSDFAHEIDSDADYLAEDLMNDLRRVKVYELVNQTWKDLGTAFCTGDYDDAAGAQLVAKTEDTKEVVLQISIRAEEVYQRQADTLIVWQEPNGKDYALSFQDLEGCSEVWDFIQEVRKHLRSLDEPGSSPPYPEYPPPTGVHIGQLPAPTLANIRDIERSLKNVVRSAPIRERIAENIVSTDFVRELVKLMHDAEDLESLPDLHALCNLMQTILMLNDQNIYEYVLRDDVFVDMVGILEYDPDFPNHKACYREFLNNNMHYREVIQFREPAIRVKVHQTYRLQYLKDVVLARVLDDPTFNILNSFIIFNQIDIVNYIQNEEYFLNELFCIFHPQIPSALPSSGSEVSMNSAGADQDQRKEETDERKAVALLLLHQFCSMGKNIQLPMRIPLFRSLVDRSVLHPVQWAFEHTDTKLRNIGGEILTVILDHDAGGVRGHILRQYDQGQNPTLLHRMSSMLASPLELGFRTQLAESYRTLMDVPGADHTNVSASPLNTITSNHSPDSPPPSNTGPTPVPSSSTSSFLNGLQQFLKNPFSPSPPSSTSPPPTDAHSPSSDAPPPHPPQQLPGIKVIPKKEDAQSEKFVDYFYKNCAEELFKPFSGVVDHEEVKDEDIPLRLGREQSDPFLYLCDLLSGFLLQHSYQSHFFVLSSNISAKVATLLYAREKHLRLSALRFFRTCLRLNNNNLLNHLKKHRVFLPILKLTLRESKRDNLLSSCCQEMFEAIRRENYQDLIDHIMTNYEPFIKELSESAIMGQRFIGLIRRWELNNEPPPRFEPPAPQSRRWGQVRATDAEDEYFNGASDEDAPASPTAQRGRPQRGMPLRRGGGGKRPSRPTNVAIPKPFPISSVALVDYQEDDEPTEGAAPPFQDSPRPRRTKRDIGHKEVTRTLASTNLAELARSTSPSSGSQGVAGGLTRTKSVADLSPMAMEDDDLIGLPVPLSYKRRREEDEEEGLERLAKRPALAGKEKEKGRERSSERVSQRTRAVSPAPSRSPADEVAEGNGSGSGSGRTAGSGTSSQKLRLKVRLGGKSAGPPPQGSPPPHTSVKVGDKG